MADNPLPPFQPVSWHSYSADQLWAQLADEDDVITRMQERAWNRTYDLLDEYRAQLERLYSALADVWPSLPGSAAESFLTQLRRLIANVAENSHVASGNALAVSRVADVLMDARGRLKPLAAASAWPPVWQDPFGRDREAAQVMAEADRAAYDYATNLRTTVPFQETRIAEYQSQGERGLVAVEGSGDAGSASGSGDGRGGPFTTSGVGGPWTSSVSTSTGSVDPVLSGGVPPAGGSSGSAPAGPAPLPGGPGGGRTGSDPWVWPGTSAGRGVGSSPGSSGRGRGRTADMSDREGRGGVGRDAAGGSHGEGPVGRSTGEGAGHGVLGSPMGGGTGGRGERRRRPKGEPYSEWVLPKGVEPVWGPAPEPTEHDPGPIAFGGR
jgi:hypothetical protein